MSFTKFIRPLTIQNGSPVTLQTDFKWLGNSIFNKLQSSKINEPTDIQKYTWAFAQQQRDMIAISKTGSGKTLGFLGGIQNKQSLVLAPTRELVEQISQEYIKYFDHKVATVYGGASRYTQIKALRRNPTLIVATPGRLLDLMQEQMVPLNMDAMVLDEADRMLDMGFEQQLRDIMSQIKRKQTLMFSATWPMSIQKLANEFLNNHVHISIGSTELSLNKDVTHEMHSKCDKMELLLKQLQNTRGTKTLIFCSTKVMVDKLHNMLQAENIKSSFMHGDCSQAARDFALSKFKQRSDILVATDVCGRGIDVNDVKYVINYDMPQNADDFIHRIGRTGRAGKKGHAISYLGDKDVKVCKELVPIFKNSDIEVPSALLEMSKMRDMSKSRGFGNRGFASRGGYGNRGGMSRFNRPSTGRPSTGSYSRSGSNYQFKKRNVE
eukprot:NODE_516_length_6577_cov_0.589379.p2 type:complete len:437 gc:universal NODE_516_length_6577_cov_0.589379:2638-3948(+)